MADTYLLDIFHAKSGFVLYFVDFLNSPDCQSSKPNIWMAEYQFSQFAISHNRLMIYPLSRKVIGPTHQQNGWHLHVLCTLNSCTLAFNFLTELSFDISSRKTSFHVCKMTSRNGSVKLGKQENISFNLRLRITGILKGGYFS